MGHLAVAFKDNAFIDTETRREDIAAKNCRPVNFDSVLCSNGTVYFSTNDNNAGFDLPVYASPLADDESVRSKNFSPKTSANSNGALKTKLSFKLTAMIKDTAHFC